MFIHHPDGYIVLDGLLISLAQFCRFEPGYALPAGYSGRMYSPGQYHHLSTGMRNDPQSLMWGDGDRYLTKRAHYARLIRLAQVVDTPLLERKVLPLWQSIMV